MSYLTGQSLSGLASISGLNDLYCDNLVATGNITCETIDSQTTDNLQEQIDAIVTGISQNQGNWGSFYSTVTQSNSPVNTPIYLTVNHADPSNNGIVWYNNDGAGNYREIKVLNDGVYNVQFSVQLTNGSSSKEDVLIWFTKNEIDVSNSTSSVTLSGNGDDLIPSWNYVYNLKANDRIGIKWASSSSQMSIPAVAAQSSPYVAPAIPSVIITLNQIINTSQGLKGDTGATGATGAQGIQGARGDRGDRGEKGDRGADGNSDAAESASALAAISAAVATTAAAACTASAATAGTSAASAATSAITASAAASESTSSSLASESSARLAEGFANDAANSATAAQEAADSIINKTINITAAEPAPFQNTIFAGDITLTDGTLYAPTVDTANIYNLSSVTVEGGLTATLKNSGGSIGGASVTCGTSLELPYVNISGALLLNGFPVINVGGYLAQFTPPV